MDFLPLDIEKLIYSYIPCCKYCNKKKGLIELYNSKKHICQKCINRQQCIIF